MKLEAVLQRLEEIEDHMEAAKRLESPLAGWSDTAWLCQVVRQLIARLKRLETVAEAARELLGFLPDSMNGEDWEWAWDQLYADSQEQVKEVRERARKALAALEAEE